MRGCGSEEEEEEEKLRKGEEAEGELSLVMKLFSSGMVFREGSKLFFAVQHLCLWSLCAHPL